MINTMFTKISTKRFILRTLTKEDVSGRYLEWLRESSNYIYTANKYLTLPELKAYVIEKSKKPDILFLGIFNKDNNLHIGNLKFEPVDVLNKIAIMGILIGDQNWRGKGVAGEVIFESANYLHKNLGINNILLGVNRLNFSAISAYKKIGFKKKLTKHLIFKSKENFSMVLNLKRSEE